MNERIRELYEQAHGRKPTMVIDHQTGQAVHATYRGEPMYTRDFDPEKFAELIVRGCIEQVEQAKNSPFVSLDDAKRMSHFVDVTKKRIEKHFRS